MTAKLPPKPSPKPAAKPGKDTIYVDVDDEITAIIDKVDNAKQQVVALVLPKRAATLQSIVNMRLLKRSATSSGKNVVLITSEQALLPLAGAAGLHVAKNLQSKPEIPPHPKGDLAITDNSGDSVDGEEELDTEPQKLDYNSSVGELAAVNEEEPEVVSLDDEDEKDSSGDLPSALAAKPKDKKNKSLNVPNFDRFRMVLLIGAAAFIGLIVFFIFASKVLPKAKITITTSSSPVTLNTELTASGTAKTLDEASKVIPSALKTQDQTANQSVTATGQKNNGDKADGSVSMTVKKCSGAGTPENVPAGVGISSNGLSYITQEAAHFSFSGFSAPCATFTSNDVNITAQSAGEKYNISDANFTIAGRSDVKATGSASGGTDNNVTVVTQSDVDKAKSKITSEDSDKFSKDFQKQLNDQGFYVLTSTLKISDPAVTSTPAVGQEASSASVTVKITYSVLAVQKSDLEKIVTNQLNKQIDQKKEKISDNNVLDGLTIDVQNQQQNSANATLVLTKDTTSVPIININAVKENAKGKKESEIKNFVNTYPGVENVDVKFSPFWVSHGPKKISKITVVQKQVKASKSEQQ